MTESKSKRVIVACTVGAVLLLVTLLSVLIYQLIAIKKQYDAKIEYEEKIALYEQLIANGEDTLETRSMRWWIECRARELGYIYEDDSSLN